MTQRRAPLLLVALASGLWVACSGHSASPKTGPQPAGEAAGGATPAEPPISAADLRRRLYTFSDDSMLGREAGTLGNVKGTNYIAAEAAKREAAKLRPITNLSTTTNLSEDTI